MDNELARKRKRTHSGSGTLTARHVTENLHRYGELILHCNVLITHTIRECGNTLVLKYVCALLNSGGGILHMHNLDVQRGIVLSKHLDTWWSGMEIKMAEILSRDDICNYFDLVGNHDDLDLYLFVKTAEHLCSLTYNCRLPTDTATHHVTYQSMLRLLVSHGEPGSLSDLPPIPGEFIFGRSAEELKKETKQIQFKQLTSSQNRSPNFQGLAEKIRSLMVKYVSAFANHEGGHIYFGIDDTRASVVGEELDRSEQIRTEAFVTNRMNSMIWRNSQIRVVRGVHWDICFCPVQRTPRKSRRVVVVVSVCKFPGAVFTDCPDSMYVQTDGSIVNFIFDDWRDAILNPLRDVPELHHRFTKLSLMVPRAPLVFTLPDNIEAIIKKVLITKPNELQPRHYIESYSKPEHREVIRKVLETCMEDSVVGLGMECWGLKAHMISSSDLICDVAIVTNSDSIHVLTFSTSNSPQVLRHSQDVAKELKTKLVQYGGLVEKFSITCHVVDVTVEKSWSYNVSDWRNKDIYPSHFSSSATKCNKILRSLAICMAIYKARSQNLQSMNEHGSYYFILTHDQFELLWTQQFTKELWVHGPAGAGKTVAALQVIQELRRRGCRHDNILYLAENEKLSEFVRSHNLCLVTTRRQLLDPAQEPNFLQTAYGNVCNVIVDEVQNFKDRDGDWYSLAEKLANQKPANYLHRCTNYFWLFMDYAQKVHKFQAGLPSVIGKHNFMLSEVSRSTKEIFDFTSRLMMASENVDGLCSPVFQHTQSLPKLAHNYSSGKGVDILSCKETEMKTLLSKVMSGLLKNGIQENDIAILVGKRTELDRLQSTLKDIHLTEKTSPSQKDKIITMETSRSIEEHLKECGSDLSVESGSHIKTPTADDEDDDENEAYTTSNPFDVLANISSAEQMLDDSANEEMLEETLEDHTDIESKRHTLQANDVTFYNPNTDDESKESTPKLETDDNLTNQSADLTSQPVDLTSQSADHTSQSADLDSQSADFEVDTVRGYSGLDKAAVIGLNPYCNEEHADFKKFILSLATRARDNLIIITTSDQVKHQLDECVK